MSRLTEINKDACDLCNLDCKHMDNSCEKAKIYNKLKYYEDLEEETEKIWGDGASITKLVNSLNKCACSADGYLDFARILTNDDAEKWLRWKELAKQGRLIELPCKAGDTVWVIRYGKVFEAKITRVVLGICNSSTYINLDVSYEFVDPFYNDGRMESMTAICRYLDDVFLTKSEAEVKLAELKGNL